MLLRRYLPGRKCPYLLTKKKKRRISDAFVEKKSAPGTPKQHWTSLSAATGEVLTRFARQRPSDLGHPKSTSGVVSG